MSERVVDFINESSEEGGEKGVAKSIDGLTGAQDRLCIAGLVGFTDDADSQTTRLCGVKTVSHLN